MSELLADQLEATGPNGQLQSREPSRLPHLVVVAGYPPNSSFGGGLILRNLLKEYPPHRLSVFTNARVLEHLSTLPDRGGLLDAAHLPIRPFRSSLPGTRRFCRFLNLGKIVNCTLGIVQRMPAGSVLLSIPWGGEFGSELFVSAYLAHRLTGTPLVVYEMDEWRASLGAKSGLPPRLLEKLFHRKILRAASSVWVISEALAEHLDSRFGVESQVLPHCVELRGCRRPQRPQRVASAPRSLFYTGAIRGAQAGAIRNVIQWMESQPTENWKLVLYTSASSKELATLGISGERLRVGPSVPIEKMPSILAAADALLLPFSFDESQRHVVSTSLPSKTADYLASGVPILVHAPSYATITKLARREGWAAVVDTTNLDALTMALRKIGTNDTFRNHVAMKAWRVAEERHDLVKRRKDFLSSIGEAAESQH